MGCRIVLIEYGLCIDYALGVPGLHPVVHPSVEMSPGKCFGETYRFGKTIVKSGTLANPKENLRKIKLEHRILCKCRTITDNAEVYQNLKFELPRAHSFSIHCFL